jgi:hypothetical protein
MYIILDVRDFDKNGLNVSNFTSFNF